MILDSHGYVRIPMRGHPRAMEGRYVLEHWLVAEKALGKPLPKLAEVHHVNEIKSDNAGSNLVICQDSAYHKLLHNRMRVRKAGGNPNLEKLCCRCRDLKPLGDFHKRARSFDGLQTACIGCMHVMNNSNYSKRARVQL